MLLVHWARRAASRADCTAGSNSAIRTAMIAITTSSSIRVKPTRPGRAIRFIFRISFDLGDARRRPAAGDGSLRNIEWFQGVLAGLDLDAERGLLGVHVPPL